jgi:hypothetical protein
MCLFGLEPFWFARISVNITKIMIVDSGQLGTIRQEGRCENPKMMLIHNCAVSSTITARISTLGLACFLMLKGENLNTLQLQPKLKVP